LVIRHSSNARVLRAWLLPAFAALALVTADARAQSSLGYDPTTDPFAELARAQEEAAAEGKLILVEAGGEWCIWCHYLGKFLTDNPDIEKALESTFVVMKVYFEEEGDNAAFFATMPKAAGYPHFWVRAADGTVLASQNTLPLEDGAKSYDRGRFRAFIDGWKARL
jgi:thiol:disulfide interchange protein